MSIHQSIATPIFLWELPESRRPPGVTMPDDEGVLLGHINLGRALASYDVTPHDFAVELDPILEPPNGGVDLYAYPVSALLQAAGYAGVDVDAVIEGAQYHRENIRLEGIAAAKERSDPRLRRLRPLTWDPHDFYWAADMECPSCRGMRKVEKQDSHESDSSTKDGGQ